MELHHLLILGILFSVRKINLRVSLRENSLPCKLRYRMCLYIIHAKHTLSNQYFEKTYVNLLYKTAQYINWTYTYGPYNVTLTLRKKTYFRNQKFLLLKIWYQFLQTLEADVTRSIAGTQNNISSHISVGKRRVKSLPGMESLYKKI